MPRLARPLVVAATLLTFALGTPDAVAMPGNDPTPTPTPTPIPAPTPQPVSTTAVSDGDPDPEHLPDFGLARVGDLRLIRTPSGSLQLRFSSTLVNVGAGPIVVRATRKKPKDEFVVAQRIRTLDGRHPFRTVQVGTVFAGDGHTHWHIRDVVRYTLSPLGETAGSKPKRRAQKVGFCLYDNERRAVREGQPTRPEFLREGCGHERDTRLLRMGLSVGWGDKYSWTLLGQYVPLTGLPAGDYRLLGQANPVDAFFEQRTDNNFVYADIRLRREKGRGAFIRILRQGVRPEGEPTRAGTRDLNAGAAAPREVDYPLWLSTPAPSTQSSRTRSRKGPSPA